MSHPDPAPTLEPFPTRAADLPVHYNAADILERNLARHPQKAGLHTIEGDLSFEMVAESANQIANALRGMDVRVGDCVAILCLDTAEWVATFFGTLRCGSVAVGMSTLMTSAEIAYILNDSRARVALVHSALLDGLQEVRDRCPFLEHVVVVGGDATGGDVTFEDWVGAESASFEATATHRDDFATLNYSSGTTGKPKGILHAHKDLALTAELWGSRTLGLTESDRTFSVAKLFFTFGLGGNLLYPWHVGASAILYPGSPRQAANVLDAIHRYRPTILFNAPTGYAAALAIDDLTERYDLSSLRQCVSAGEALPAPLWHAWKDRTGLDILDGIGSTENFHIFLSNRPGDIRPGSSGRPVEGYEMRIVDEEGARVAPGEVGSLHVKGETAAHSYLHDSGRSRETFLGAWLNTGDKYHEDDDGYFWHAGPSDDMLKVGGIWVSPVEVESTLIGHEAVLECAVVGACDDADLIKPKAFVVPARGVEPSEQTAEALVQHCIDSMAAYKRPRWIEFVEELPKTATGKIQRFRLRRGDTAADPATDSGGAPPPLWLPYLSDRLVVCPHQLRETDTDVPLGGESTETTDESRITRPLHHTAPRARPLGLAVRRGERPGASPARRRRHVRHQAEQRAALPSVAQARRSHTARRLPRAESRSSASVVSEGPLRAVPGVVRQVGQAGGEADHRRELSRGTP